MSAADERLHRAPLTRRSARLDRIAGISLTTVVLIAIAVCGTFAFHVRRSTLEIWGRDRAIAAFLIALFGWLAVVSALAIAGVFQASASESFPTTAVGLAHDRRD